MPFVLVLSGLPGVGKSELASLLLTASSTEFGPPSRITVVCQDVLGSRKKCEREARSALSSGRSVVVDRTNIDATQRAHWFRIAQEFSVPADVVTFDCSREVCARRCDARLSHPTIKPGQGRRVVAMMGKDQSACSQSESSSIRRIFKVRESGGEMEGETAVVEHVLGLLAAESGSVGSAGNVGDGVSEEGGVKKAKQEEGELKEAARVCENCGKEAAKMQQCSRCKLVRYCSGECQLKHWKEHKKSCKKAATGQKGGEGILGSGEG